MRAPAYRNISLEEALREAEERYIAANPKSRARHVDAARHLPGGNTRSILFYPPFPVTMVRGEGRACSTSTATPIWTSSANTRPGSMGIRIRLSRLQSSAR